MSKRSAKLALVGISMVGACCPDLVPSALTPLEDPALYPTGLSDANKAAIRWKKGRSSCETVITANGGALSMIVGDASSLTPGGTSCEFEATLVLPPGSYLRSLAIHARGALQIEQGEALAGTVGMRRDCSDGGMLIDRRRTYEWSPPQEPGAEPDEPSGYEYILGDTALMTAAHDIMCNGRVHEIALVASVKFMGERGLASLASLDSVDMYADVASCSSTHFEDMCESARIAYGRMAHTDAIDPPTLDVADSLALGVTLSSDDLTEPECRDDLPVVRKGAEQRLQARRDVLEPLLQQRCSEQPPTGHDLETLGGMKVRQCRARQALAFLGADTGTCTCTAQ